MANLRRKMELASTMFGGNQRGASQPTQTHQTRITAVAAADSDAGEVAIELPDETVVTVPTLAPVAEGEEVIVELQNTKAVVIGKPGWGDALDATDKAIRADLDVAEDSITALVEATTVSGGSAEEAYSVDIPANAAVLTAQTIYGRYVQEGTPSPSDPAPISTVAPTTAHDLPTGCIGVVLSGDDYEEIIAIDLQGYTLAALPDGTRDVLTIDADGSVTLTKKVGYRLIDGSDTTNASNATLKIYRSYLPETTGYDATSGLGISSHYPTDQRVNNQQSDKTCKQATNGVGNPAGHAAFFRDTSLANIAAFRAFIAANPIQFFYKLLDSVEIDLGTVDLPELPDMPLTWSVAAAIPATGECEWLTYFGVMSEGEYASKAELAITEGQIMTEVSETYTTKTETQTISTQVNQNANNITTLITDVDGIETMIRGYSGGVLVGKPPSSGTSGTTVCALVSASGEYDVVQVTWSRTTTDDPWAPQSYTTPPLNKVDANGMTVSDGSGNELLGLGDGEIAFLEGIAGMRTVTYPIGENFQLFREQSDSRGDAYTLLSFPPDGGFELSTKTFDDTTAGPFIAGTTESTSEGYHSYGLVLSAPKDINIVCSDGTYHPIRVNNKPLADFPTEYRAASLGEAIPNVSAKPSESARLLGWSYQKYASGLAHMWGVMPFNGSIATARGAMFMAAADTVAAFPFDVARILSVTFGQGFASDYTWGLTAYPHLSTAVWQAGNHWGINWRAAAPVSGSYGGYIPIDVWAYVE